MYLLYSNTTQANKLIILPGIACLVGVLEKSAGSEGKGDLKPFLELQTPSFF